MSRSIAFFWASVLSLAVCPSLLASSLDIVGTSGPSAVRAGTDVKYTVAVLNQASDAVNAAITFETSPGFTFAGVTQNDGFSCDTPAVGASGVVTCHSALFSRDREADFALQYHVDPALAPDTTLTIKITTTAGGTRQDGETLTAHVAGPADGAVVFDSQPLVAGATAHFTATVTNNGPNKLYAPALKLTVTQPTASIGLNSPSWFCSNFGTGTNSCVGPSIDPGGSLTVPLEVQPSYATAKGTSITITAQLTMPNDDPSTANNTFSRTGTVDTLDDLLVTASSTSRALAGADITASFQVTRKGPSDSGLTTLTYDIPPTTTFKSLQQSGGFACTAPAAGATGTIRCTMSHVDQTLGPSLTVALHTTTPGTIMHSATVTASVSDPDSSNNTATSQTVLTGPPDLSLSIAAAPEHPRPGDLVTFTITARNDGDGDASGVVVHNTLPPEVDFVSSAPFASAPGEYHLLVDAHSSQSITITARVHTGTHGTITDTATVSDPSETNTSNNSASLSVTLNETVVDLTASVTASEATVHRFDDVRWDIIIGNRGPSTATNVKVNVTLPFTFTSFNTPAGVSCANNQGVVCTIASLPANASQTFSIHTAAPNQAGSGTRRCTATTTTNDQNEAAPSDNTASLDVNFAGPNVDLSASFSADKTTAPPGDLLTCTLTTKNRGTDTAFGAVVVFETGLGNASTIVSTTSARGTCTAAQNPFVGTRVSCPVDSIGPNETLTTTIVLRAPIRPNKYTFSGYMTSDESSTLNTAQQSLTVTSSTPVATADLVVSVSAPLNVIEDSVVVYDVEVKNRGTLDVPFFDLVDTLPSSLKYVDAVGMSCSPGSSVRCSGDRLPVGATAKLKISAQALALGSIANTVSVSMIDPETSTTNNSATAMIVVQPPARHRGAHH